MTLTIGERLKQVRGATPQEDLAKALGVHKNTVGLYERGARVPDAEYLLKVLDAIPGVDAGWLLTGKGPDLCVIGEQGALYFGEAKTQATDEGRGRRQGDRYCLIPLYNKSPGGGMVYRENLVDFLSFKAEWIETHLNASPPDLYLIIVEGESMEPTLRPGDVLLVDHRQAPTLPSDGIYVVRMDGTLLVKRLQRLPGSQVRVTSDNPAYEPFVVNLANRNEVEIVGRVVWCGRRM